MKKTILFNIIVIFCLTYSCAQNKNAVPEIIETLNAPIINDSLTVSLSNCKYFDEDIYIVNSNNVIYQNCNERKYLSVNISSFTFPKYNERGFFALDKNGIYYRGHFIKTDTTGFKIVGRNNNYNNPEVLWKTKNDVYKNANPIQVSDVASFESIKCFNSYYYKDKNYIYYFDKKIEGSDGSSVIKSCANYCFDKNHFYLNGDIVTFDNENVKPINSIIFKTSKHVLTKEFVKLDMDAQTIKKLSRAYAIDKNYVYYKTDKLPIKPENFKNVKVWDQINRAYVTDGINVYAGYNTLETDFDAKTFGMLPHSDFCYDKNGVYERKYIARKKKVVNKKFPFKYDGFVTPENTFITEDSRYIIYKNQAYDPWTKRLYKDLTKTQITQAKENKLSISITANQVVPIEKEFEYLLTQEDNKIFWNTIETIADAATFKRIGYYYKDKDRVYWYNREKGLITIKGIDAKTAKTLNTFLVDKESVFHSKTRLIKSKDVQLLGVFTGYRLGCGMDETPSSNYYLFKNIDGYWLVQISGEVSIRNLGKTLGNNWNPHIKNFELL